MGKRQMNYDPNLVLCGREAEFTVNLIFGLYKFRRGFTAIVSGNGMGLDMIDCAVEKVYDDLPINAEGNKQLILKDSQRNELVCADDEGNEERWLKDMLISAEILEIEPFNKNKGENKC